jgi:mycothiol system anti-sigma-R factor
MRRTAMLPCEHVLARLWEYIDGELEPETELAVQRHLEQCARCYPQYNFERAYTEMLRRMAQRMDPPALRSRVLQRLLEEQVESEG